MGCDSDRYPTGTAAHRDGVREDQRENDCVVSVYAVDSISNEEIMKKIGDKGSCYTLITHAQP